MYTRSYEPMKTHVRSGCCEFGFFRTCGWDFIYFLTFTICALATASIYRTVIITNDVEEKIGAIIGSVIMTIFLFVISFLIITNKYYMNK